MSIARLSDKEQWELFIPEMGYMALLRNLRNFDDAQVDDKLVKQVADKLSDPGEVAKSKQFPYAFHTAWMNVPSPRWKQPLDKALNLSVPNIPVLDGRNLILIDTSNSMTSVLSQDTPMRSKKKFTSASGEKTQRSQKRPTRMGAAALFGIALGRRNKGKVDLHSFATGHEDLTHLVHQSTGILDAMDKFTAREGRVGHGTDIGRAIRETYRGHDRVFVFTDMQTVPDEYENIADSNWDVTAPVPQDKHVYGFNLAGYTNTAVKPTGFRHDIGGLTDATFSLIKNLESGVAGTWPWS